MVLSGQNSSKHNQMLGKWIKQAKPSEKEAVKPPPSKRRRLDDPPSNSQSATQRCKWDSGIVPDSDEEGVDDVDDLQPSVQKTDLESALPAVVTDAEAIQEYEAYKVSQDGTDEKTTTSEGRFQNRDWVRGKSSIYVDAFNLALDTVLEEESHLFDEAEMEVFRQWMGLDYEAQYLLVM